MRAFVLHAIASSAIATHSLPACAEVGAASSCARASAKQLSANSKTMADANGEEVDTVVLHEAHPTFVTDMIVDNSGKQL